jgi:DNA-binding NarL/FixJ family response regulator
MDSGKIRLNDYPEPVRILIVDDSTLFRKGLRELLTHYTKVNVVGEAYDGDQALDVARKTLPDVILMDIDMPNCNGIIATKNITEELPNTKILMLTVAVDDDSVFEAIKSGAQGYILKDTEPEKLFEYIDACLHGEAPLSGKIALKILHSFQKTSAPVEKQKSEYIEHLTRRETELLKLVALGKSNKEIGKTLVLSENTVKKHISNIIDKLHVENRIQAAALALRKETNK